MGRGATPNNQKGNQIQMSETKQIFIPVPVPGVAGTMVQSHIDKLSDLGMYGSRSIRVWASRFDWGSQPEAKGLFPEEGKGTKLWQHTALVGQENAPEKQDYVFLVWGPDKLAHIQLTATGDKAGFSHPSFNIYSQAAARLYQDYLPLFQQWGGVPMIEWKPVGKAEALRINVSEGTSSPIPLAHWLDEAKTTHTFPSNMALRFNPATGVIEAFLIADFVREFGNPAQYYATNPLSMLHTAIAVPNIVPATLPRTPAPAVDSIIADRTINADSGMYITSEGELITRVEDERGERQALATGFVFHTLSGKFGDGAGSWAGNYPDASTCLRALEILRPEILAQGGKDIRIQTYDVAQVQGQPVIRCKGPDGEPREFNIHNTITAIAGKILLRKGELVYAWGPTVADMVKTAFGGG
jgi:hypothetical protein